MCMDCGVMDPNLVVLVFLCVCQRTCLGFKKEYLVIILGYCFLFLHKSICYEYSLEVPH